MLSRAASGQPIVGCGLGCFVSTEMEGRGVKIHATAEVSPAAAIGMGTSVWNEAQVREGARIGRDCILAKGVYVDADVVVGDRVKLENRVSLFRGARLGSGVFVGPHSCLLNDKRPRATAPGGGLKRESNWIVSGVTVAEGASIGGGCTILPGVRIGRFAMVGAGAVVTRDVPDHGLVAGNPARLVGYVCECGYRLRADGTCAACLGPTQRMPA
jgi:acetyltransferase-like isoleucine patch superfamily enzyme